ncbi:MAG: hypothetical protein OXI48_13485, partial [bacterium]|nr:hypothetical protein [bacterium]
GISFYFGRLLVVALASLAGLVAALAPPPPPPVEAQDVHGKVIATATWNFGAGGPEPGEEPPQRYQDIADNFFMVGATVAFTTTVIEDITNSRGEITGNRITVRCNPDLICRWNGGDVRVEGNFTEESKDHGLPERVEYVDPADLDSDDLDSKDRERVEREIARAPNPVGTVQANPRARTVDRTPDGKIDQVLLHCGMHDLEPTDRENYPTDWTTIVGDPSPSRLTVLQFEEFRRSYTEVYAENDNTISTLADRGAPIGCKLIDERGAVKVEWVDIDNDGVRNISELKTVTESTPGGTLPVFVNAPATRPLLQSCPYGFQWKGRECVIPKTNAEYAPSSTETRHPSITSPEQSLPAYEPPTQQQIDRCEGDRFCLDRLHINAANEYDRELERYSAKWARYEKELDKLEASGEPFWSCIPFDEWEEAVQGDFNSHTSRCYLVEYAPADS